MKKTKIGILRGLMPRSAQSDFSRSFTKFKSIFLTDKNLGQKNIFWFDPVKLLLRRTTHQSWVGVDIKKLEEVSKDLDLIETYELFHFFSAQAVDVSQKLNKPLITEVWTSFPTHPAYFLPPYSFNAKKVIKNTSLFIARSNRAQKALIKLGIPKNKIRMIYHGVDIEKFKPKLSTVHRSPFTFLFVGEMKKYKGVNVILKAWKIYHAKHTNSQLWMVGGGKIKPSGDGIKYFGYVDHYKLPKIYQQADVFLSPSINRYIGPFLWWEEFFSYTLMEAMASGLSIIATNSGGIPEEIGDKNIIIKQNSVEELVKAMEKVNIKNSNRQRAEKFFDLKKQTAKLEYESQKLISH